MDYRYLCIDTSGKEIKGILSANDLSDARLILKDRGLKIVSVEEKKGHRKTRLSFRKKKITDTDLYGMSKELNVLLRAGLRIDTSLDILNSSTSNEELKEKISEVTKDIRAGKAVAEAFERTDKFSPLMITMIRVGESVGDLKMSFEHIARHLQFHIQFRSEIRNATTYPIFLIFASIVTLFVIFKFIIPKFFSIFGEAQQQSLPFAARLLYAASQFFNIYVILLGIVGVVILFKVINPKRLFTLGYSYALSVPGLRSLIVNLELSRFSYSMHTMLASGIEFINALRLSAGLIQNSRIRDSIEPSIASIREGRDIAEVFSHIDILPDIVVNMVSVGEKSGNMKEIFLELFEIFDDRFKTAVKQVVTLIEPIIITIMGLIVGFIVISLILTVMSVGNIKL